MDAQDVVAIMSKVSWEVGATDKESEVEERRLEKRRHEEGREEEECRLGNTRKPTIHHSTLRMIRRCKRVVDGMALACLMQYLP